MANRNASVTMAADAPRSGAQEWRVSRFVHLLGGVGTASCVEASTRMVKPFEIPALVDPSGSRDLPEGNENLEMIK